MCYLYPSARYARNLFREVEGSGRGATKAARDKGEGGVQTSVGDRVRAPGVAFATGARPRRRGCHSRRRAHPHADPAARTPSNRSGGVPRSRPVTAAFVSPASIRVTAATRAVGAGEGEAAAALRQARRGDGGLALRFRLGRHARRLAHPHAVLRAGMAARRRIRENLPAVSCRRVVRRASGRTAGVPRTSVRH